MFKKKPEELNDDEVQKLVKELHATGYMFGKNSEKVEPYKPKVYKPKTYKPKYPTAKKESDHTKEIGDILKNHQAKKIDGFIIDVQTAGAINMLLRTLNPKNKANLLSMPIERQAKIAWDFIK